MTMMMTGDFEDHIPRILTLHYLYLIYLLIYYKPITELGQTIQTTQINYVKLQ